MLNFGKVRFDKKRQTDLAILFVVQDQKSKVEKNSDQKWGSSSSVCLAGKPPIWLIDSAQIFELIFSFEESQFWSKISEILDLRNQ